MSSYSKDSTDDHEEADMSQDIQSAALTMPDAPESSEGEGGKFKMIVQLFKRCLGVKDIAALRLSLPASLLEPIPNLEYWHYLDRPDLFAAINDSEDPLERMLAVLRFTFSKDLKYVHGKVCKPYNSVLGEHFRAHWDVLGVAYRPDKRKPPVVRSHIAPDAKLHSDAHGELDLSRNSEKIGEANRSTTSFSNRLSAVESTLTSDSSSGETSGRASVVTNANTVATAATSVSANIGQSDRDGGPIRVVYLTEQVSHHPPISAYVVACPQRALSMSGIDQIVAKVSGTTASIRVISGPSNRGIFVHVGKIGAGANAYATTLGVDGLGAAARAEGEEMYHITSPAAHVNGLLRGNFYVTAGESAIITCMSADNSQKKGLSRKQRLRVVIEYKEEGWLGKPQYLLEGVIHTYTESSTPGVKGEHEDWTKVKHVPRNRVVVQFEGNWRGQVRYRYVNLGLLSLVNGYAGSTTSLSPPSMSSLSLSSRRSQSDANDWHPLIDLSELRIVPKRVRPIAEQLPNESRRLWEGVTTRMLKKDYSEATRVKHTIEQKQREEAEARKKRGEEFVPAYFDRNIESGVPTLTPAGKKAVEDELAAKYEEVDVGFISP